MERFSTVRPLLMAALFTLCASCGESTTQGPACVDPQGGTFTGDASGVGSLRGCASYGVSSSSGSPITALVFTAGDPSSPTPVLTMARDGGRPAAGSYTVGAAAGNFAGSILLNGQSFGLSSGTVAIDVSSSGQLQGSVNVTGTRSGAGGSVTIAGTFIAVCTAVGAVTC